MPECMISDGENCYVLRHGGKEFGLEEARLNNAGEPDWDTSQAVDWLRLSVREDHYLKVIFGMLVMLERMQKEK